MFRRVSAGTVFALFVAFLLACDDHDEFREDVVLCEEAVARLKSCCPGGRAPSYKCHYRYDANVDETSGGSSSNDSGEGDGWSGCNDREVKPDLDADQSRAILSASCSHLSPKCSS